MTLLNSGSLTAVSTLALAGAGVLTAAITARLSIDANRSTEIAERHVDVARQHAAAAAAALQLAEVQIQPHFDVALVRGGEGRGREVVRIRHSAPLALLIDDVRLAGRSESARLPMGRIPSVDGSDWWSRRRAPLRAGEDATFCPVVRDGIQCDVPLRVSIQYRLHPDRDAYTATVSVRRSEVTQLKDQTDAA